MAKVLIAGGTGLIGRQLSSKLLHSGYDVAVLSRRDPKNWDVRIPVFHWDVADKFIDREALDSVDYIVHLAGANIGEKRWTDLRKKEIINSRIKSAELLLQHLNEREHNLKTFISASAIGYYGSITSDKVFDETNPPAEDFLGQTCDLWEQSADMFAGSGCRVVKIRTGIVLSKQGGVQSRFRKPVKAGLGSALGKGNQYFPWIHVEDLSNLYLRAVQNTDMTGSYNAVAPEHITNKEFVRKMAKNYNKPFWFPNIPSPILRMLFGELSVMLLNGSRISSEKIEAAGFKFSFPTVDSALQDLCK